VRIALRRGITKKFSAKVSPGVVDNLVEAMKCCKNPVSMTRYHE